MNGSWLDDWLTAAPLAWMAALVFVILLIAAGIGAAGRNWQDSRASARNEAKGEDDKQEAQDGYVVSAVLGLLALLMGFTFALAVDRFETRRALVLDEANAIGAAYLRTQLLQPPHRERISKLLTEYAENRLALSHARERELPAAIEINDRLITDLWTATSAAFPTIKGMDFSSAYLDSMNNLIDLDASRKAAHLVRVPTAVYGVLLVYMVMTAAVMGYVLVGFRGRLSAVFMLVLLVLSLALIIDIDRPGVGAIREGQGPIEALLKSIKSQPPTIYDRWLEAPTP